MNADDMLGGPERPMIVTGVQSVGSKGVSSVQVAAVDAKDLARSAAPADAERDNPTLARGGEPQPVVFPRDGSLPLDQRPVSLRQQVAALRYQRDGGEDDDREQQQQQPRR